MAHLILARHGESEFNAKSLWTGQWDVPLTPKGEGEAVQMGRLISDIPVDVAYTSGLERAPRTLEMILKTNHQNVPVHQRVALNERDYGELTGLNKWEVEDKYSQVQFQLWRRGWREAIPGGETLEQVYQRA